MKNTGVPGWLLWYGVVDSTYSPSKGPDGSAEFCSGQSVKGLSVNRGRGWSGEHANSGLCSTLIAATSLSLGLGWGENQSMNHDNPKQCPKSLGFLHGGDNRDPVSGVLGRDPMSSGCLQAMSGWLTSQYLLLY